VRTREAQLADARTKAEALRATIAPRLVPEVDQRAGHEAVACRVAAAVVELTDGFTAPLAYLACLGSLAGKATAEQRDHAYGQLVTFLRGWVGSMYRRGLLELLGWAAAIVAVSPVVTGLDRDEQERLVRAIVSPDRVDERVIDHFAAMFAHCKRQDDALGSRAVLSTVLAQRDLVRSLLTECPVSLQPRLLSVYSDISTSVGFYLFNLNGFDSA
jgi:hypothetical protein